MTREEARKHIKNNLITLHDIDENVIECNDAMGIIDQIFNDHEAQLKAKDEEIERLKIELDNMCNGYNNPMAWKSVKDDDDVFDTFDMEQQ